MPNYTGATTMINGPAGAGVTSVTATAPVASSGGTTPAISLDSAAAISQANTMTGTAVVASGLTGATSTSRYVGATTSGAPATGTFAVGDYTIDQTGSIWICTTAGTVGSGGIFTSASGTSVTYATPGSSAVGDSAGAGAATSVSRSDHVHGREGFSTPSSLTVSQAQSTGSALTVNHSDHQHAMPGSGTPGAVTGGATASAGVAASLSLSDHVHATSNLALLDTANTFTTSLTVQAGLVTAPAVSISGLTGATAASRYVGATASGAPTSGTFLLGDHVVDQAGSIHVCTTGGTPGTWVQPGTSRAMTLALGYLNGG